MEHDRDLCWFPGKECQCECHQCVWLKGQEADDE